MLVPNGENRLFESALDIYVAAREDMNGARVATAQEEKALPYQLTESAFQQAETLLNAVVEMRCVAACASVARQMART